MRYIFVFLALVLCTSCKAQTDKSLIKNWKTYPVPSNPDSLRKLIFSPDDWIVFLKNNEVNVISDKLFIGQNKLPFDIKSTKNEPFKYGGKQSIIKVDDGYLVAFYRGEFGGSLYWFSDDGKQNYEISGDEILDFIQRDNKILAIEGLAHLSISIGSILQIQKNRDKWIVKTYLKLPSAPEAICLDNQNNLIVVTSKSLLKVDPHGTFKSLIEKGIWDDSMYPSSIAITGNEAFIGMRKGVFKYNLKSGNQEWLLRD